jgi:ribosomal protein S18 acetylase RimI-like enzyme
MTIGENKVASSQNLIQTYLRLGLAIEGATWTREQGFNLCLGELDHPICNFAADLNLDPWSARKLEKIAHTKPNFNVYVATGDRPDHYDEILRMAGFTSVYRLLQLVAQPSVTNGSAEVKLCGPREREPVSQFMVNQFFAQRSAQFRLAIARATATAPDIELYRLEDRSKPIAAVMLSEAAGVLGCYNLCVAPAYRGRGFGTSVVKWMLEQAANRGLQATVQCEGHLEGWYRALGFERAGWLQVYRLSKEPSFDIIDMV